MTRKQKPRNPLTELLATAQEDSIFYRQQALKVWWDTWIAEVEGTQHVLNNKYLGLEHRDIIRERLALNCLDQCMNEVSEFIEDDKTINIKFKALRRKPRM